MICRAVCVGLLLSILPIAGCGTVTNLVGTNPEVGGKSPFGGVRQDEYWLKMAVNGEAGCKQPAEPGAEQRPQVGRVLLYAADLPLSFVGDVVTWPYTAGYSWVNQPVLVPPMLQATYVVPPQSVPATEKQAGGNEDSRQGSRKRQAAGQRAEPVAEDPAPAEAREPVELPAGLARIEQPSPKRLQPWRRFGDLLLTRALVRTAEDVVKGRGEHERARLLPSHRYGKLSASSTGGRGSCRANDAWKFRNRIGQFPCGVGSAGASPSRCANDDRIGPKTNRMFQASMARQEPRPPVQDRPAVFASPCRAPRPAVWPAAPGSSAGRVRASVETTAGAGLLRGQRQSYGQDAAIIAGGKAAVLRVRAWPVLSPTQEGSGSTTICRRPGLGRRSRWRPVAGSWFRSGPPWRR